MEDMELERRFSPKMVNEGQVQRAEGVAAALLAAAREVVAATPAGREQSVAITKLEEARAWANFAITREDSVEEV